MSLDLDHCCLIWEPKITVDPNQSVVMLCREKMSDVSLSIRCSEKERKESRSESQSDCE